MIKAVVDTNVLASGLVAHGKTTPPVQVVDAWRARLFTLVLSRHILVELARTLLDPYFRRRLASAEIAADVALLRRQAVIVVPHIHVSGVATHPEDDLLLAAAVSASADYLVTGDTRLQRLVSFRGVVIVSPRGFLETLR